MALTVPAHVMGLIVSGDVAGMTIFTDRFGRKSTYPATFGNKPPSAGQLRQRDRFRRAILAWNALDIVDRENYELAVQRLSLCMTGHGLWNSLCLKYALGTWRTLCHQSSLPLHAPALL